MQDQSTVTGTPRTSTFKPRVRRLGPDRYLVESASRPGVGHPVTLNHCNCTGYAYRGMCRHIALVQALAPRMEQWYAQAHQQEEAREKATRAAARPSGRAALMECFG